MAIKGAIGIKIRKRSAIIIIKRINIKYGYRYEYV
jgi:hypothetical protein